MSSWPGSRMGDDAFQPGGVQTCLDCGGEAGPDETVCPTCGASLDNAAARALIGTSVLGVYEIIDVLGQGGMSVVYKGRHKMTDQVVALKILPPELAVHTALRARFLEEAKALARLEHPNIVRLYHFGEEGGRFVLAMQFVEGRTFERIIFREKRLPWQRGGKIICELLRALEYAHARGVVHRDIKPSNVIVRDDDTAMVMDFGIAKITRESSRLTSTGQTMGTVRYMSPEQVRGAQVDFRSDLYSAGVSLYESIVGDTPFDGNTHFDIMTKHLSEQPVTPGQRGVDIPLELEAAIMKSMAKDPAARHESATDFRQELERCLGVAVPDGPATASVRPNHPPALSVVENTNPLVLKKAGLDQGAGVADSLAPEPSGTSAEVAILRPRRRTGLWLGLGLLVLGAAAAVIVFIKMGGGSAAATGASDAGRAWPEPLIVAGLTPQADETFRGAEQVRVIAPRAVDAAHLARVYQAARARFEDYLKRKHIGKTFEVHPLNLVVAPPAIMCSRELWSDAPPQNCETERIRYLDKHMTLYVLDSEDLEAVNLPEGAAAHLCRSTLALLEIGCNKNLLPSFWDEVEGKEPEASGGKEPEASGGKEESP